MNPTTLGPVVSYEARKYALLRVATTYLASNIPDVKMERGEIEHMMLTGTFPHG
jgi:hypothetical protein